MGALNFQQMTVDPFFIFQKPTAPFLSTLIDTYFYVDAPVSSLGSQQEYIIPYPRITFGYFFNHPFLVTNHTLHQTATVNSGISCIAAHRITVQPQSDRIRILGAHAKPFWLAYLTPRPIFSLPLLINPADLLGDRALTFQREVESCAEPEGMFRVMESLFLESMGARELSDISNAIAIIERRAGTIPVSEVAAQMGVSDRTIRTLFGNYIGCSPKEYARLVRLRQVAYQMKQAQDSLTGIAHDNHYFDQAHFIHEIRDITGKSPSQLKREIPTFRFLQF